jgi:hypothetical protein
MNNNKRFYIHMWHKNGKDQWSIEVRENCNPGIVMRFEPFGVDLPQFADDRFKLWDLRHTSFSASSNDEIAATTRLLNRINKLAGFGSWHLLPYELIKKGFKPIADAFPARVAS